MLLLCCYFCAANHQFVSTNSLFSSDESCTAIARTQQDIADKGAQQQMQAQAQAVGSGAFGGSRQAVLQGQIASDVMDQQARTGAQLRSAGFQQAQQAAQQAAAQQLRQAQLTGQLGQTIGALGTQTAGLGQLGQQMGVQDVNTLLGIGGLQQGQSQREFDVARANALAEQALPYQQVGFMSDIFRGVPALQQTYSTTTSPGPSTSSQLSIRSGARRTLSSHVRDSNESSILARAF